MKRQSTYTNEEIALAYELRQEGCQWKRIAQGIGGNPMTLYGAVYRALKNGIAHG